MIGTGTAYHVWHIILHYLGLTNGSGYWYLLWSGIFADVTIFAAAAGLYRHHNCHTAGCWRLAKFPVEGTPFKVCMTHHPKINEAPKAEHLRSTWRWR